MPRPIKVKEKWKGKEWYQILTPKFLGDIAIGETPSADVELLKNRVVEMTLFDLTNDPSKYYIKFFFKANSVEGNRIYTKFLGHECTRDFLARVVHKYIQRVDSNDIIAFSDGVKIRVKSIAICNQKVNANITTKIRKKISEILALYSKKSSEDFIRNLITGGFQENMKRELSRIYPLRVFEFRKSEVL